MKPIAICLNPEFPYNADVIKGIIRFQTEHGLGPARLIPVDTIRTPPITEFSGFLSSQIAAWHSDVPVVYLDQLLPPTGSSSITIDHEAVGNIAASHFIERHYVNFGYFSIPLWSRWNKASIRRSEYRQNGFRDALLKRGALNRSAFSICLAGEFEEIETWLAGLPKPAGILAFNDAAARYLIQVCGTLGISVPDEIAVLGMDNDLTICRFTTPSISSLQLPAFEIGYEAAKLLAMRTGKIAPTDIRFNIPPVRLIERESTGGARNEDPRLQKAIAFIRKNSAQSIHVDDVAKAVPYDPKSLQRLFRKGLNSSIQERIISERIRRAAGLLLETPDSAVSIAEQCGFGSYALFKQQFKKRIGATAGHYRKNGGMK